MCYYNTYFFLGCGHISYSDRPVPKSHCPILASAADDLPAQPTCTDRFNHPLHTFGIETLCPACKDERDARVDFFTAQVGEDLEGRILSRSAERNERGGSEHGKRLFRASTTLAMMMDSGKPKIEEASNRMSVTSRSLEVGKMVDGLRGAVGWDQGGSSFRFPVQAPKDPSLLSPGSETSRPPTRLSFLALAAEDSIGSRT